MASSTRNAKMKIIFMLVITLVVFFIEIAVGYVSNSMSLVADAFHMLSDCIALTIAFISLRLATSNKRTSKNTFGWARAEVLGALINSVFLCALCFSILVESVKRFYEPHPIKNPLLVLIVGAVGLLVNLIGLFAFHESGDDAVNKAESPVTYYKSIGSLESSKEKSTSYAEQAKIPKSSDSNRMGSKLSSEGVFLHILADAFGSVIVCVSAIVLLTTDWKYSVYIDPSLSVVSVTLILLSTKPLLTRSAAILLQTVPKHIKVETLEREFLIQFPVVLAIHDFHVWQLSGETIIATCHVICQQPTLSVDDYTKLTGEMKEFFHQRNIHSTTIQIEYTNRPSDTAASQPTTGNNTTTEPSTGNRAPVPPTTTGTTITTITTTTVSSPSNSTTGPGSTNTTTTSGPSSSTTNTTVTNQAGMLTSRSPSNATGPIPSSIVVQRPVTTSGPSSSTTSVSVSVSNNKPATSLSSTAASNTSTQTRTQSVTNRVPSETSNPRSALTIKDTLCVIPCNDKSKGKKSCCPKPDVSPV